MAVNDEELRANNEHMLKQEINFALHLKLSGCILLNISNNNDSEAVGKVVKECLKRATSFEGRILVEMSMINYKKLTMFHFNDIDDSDEKVDEQPDQWDIWYKFYAATGFHYQIEVSKSDVSLYFQSDHIFLGRSCHDS